MGLVSRPLKIDFINALSKTLEKKEICTYLNSNFGEIHLPSQFFPSKSVWIMCSLKDSLQGRQLIRCELRPVSSNPLRIVSAGRTVPILALTVVAVRFANAQLILIFTFYKFMKNSIEITKNNLTLQHQ